MQSKSGIPISWLRRVKEFTEGTLDEPPTSDQEAVLRREAKAAVEARKRVEKYWKEPTWRVIGIF